jgi:hypothetical protein
MQRGANLSFKDLKDSDRSGTALRRPHFRLRGAVVRFDRHRFRRELGCGFGLFPPVVLRMLRSRFDVEMHPSRDAGARRV